MRAPLVPILLVEDDEVDCEATRRALQREEIPNPLYLARDGVEALELLRGELSGPCLVLLDLNMPRMDGFELLDELRRDADLARPVVWVLTTSARAEDKARAWELSLAGYVLKEDLLDLARVLGEYCRINQFPPQPDGRGAAAAG